MADALQMFLMTAGPLQLGSSSAAKDYVSEAPLPAEALPFAAQLAEVGEQPIALTERQKAAAASSLTDDLPIEPVNPESLQAILADDQSTADEKDAARAWLTIIRAGQQERAGITLIAASAKQAPQTETETQDATPADPQQRRSAVVLAASEQPVVANGAEAGFQQDAKAVAKSKTDTPAEQAKAAVLMTETAKASSGQAVVSATRQAVSEKPGRQNVADVEIEHTASVKTAANLAASKASKASKASMSSIELATRQKAKMNEADAKGSKADAKVSKADTTVRMADTKVSQADSLIATVDSKSAGVLADVDRDELAMDSELFAEAELAEKVTPATEKTLSDSVKRPLSKAVATDQAPLKDDSSTAKLAATDRAADAIQPAMPPSAAELTVTAGLASVASAEVSNQPQTLAAAVQARVEAQSNVTQAATQSDEQKSDDTKDQSMTSALLSAMQQARTEKGQASGERFDATPEQQHAVSEDSQQRAVNSSQSASSLGLAGHTTASQQAAMAPGTAQMVQSQGSASVQPASASPSVSELLRQPLNLLAADASGQLRERLVMMVRNSVHSAEIKLDPAELGSMHIRVSMQQEQASVQFLVQQAHAKEILEQQLPRLRDMLGEQGIELADGQVSQQQSGQQQQQQTAAGNAMAEDEEVLMQEQRLSVAKPSNRLVDYYA